MASKSSLPRLLIFLISQAFTTSLANPVLAQRWEPWGSASVNTTSGDITGHLSTYPGVYEYLGIPYAQPPLGNLRFMPPLAYTGSTPIAADRQPLSCIQAPSTINYSEPLNWQHISLENGIFANFTSEDCLYLNVWTRPMIPRQGLRPVMIWFYGGGFHSGGISDPAEQGGIFTYEDDVVFVSVNYRLGIFGFSGIPGLSQNVGFLDQRLAVEWIRDNAEAFGGDPQRIMIFGHSAGGSSVDYYNYAWVDDPIIAASSPMSGSVDNFGRRYSNTTAAGWYETSKLLGCGTPNTTDNATILSCVRNKPASEVLHASENATKIVASMLSSEAQVYIGITGLFGPTIDNKTVFANYTDRANEGQIARRPALIGENNDEGCFFAQKGQIPIPYEAVVTESVFVCPGAWAALWRANNSIPVWKYSWEGKSSPGVCPEQRKGNLINTN